MSKKLLLIVFLCFFVFSTGVGGEDKKADVIEFLSWGGGFDPNLFQFTPDDHTQLERFNSDTLVTLHIPPSPKNDVLLFFLHAQFWYKWTSFHLRHAECIIYFRLTSDIIPEDISVWSGATIVAIHETNNSGNYSIGRERSWRTDKSILKRNSLEVSKLSGFRVAYKSTGNHVPDEIAVPLINSLIDNGFDVEIWARGSVKGIKWIDCVTVKMEVTRLSKE